MKKAAFFFSLILLTIAPMARSQDEEKIQELFQNAIQKMGGDAFLKYADLTTKGQRFYFNDRGENSGMIKFTSYTKFPDKRRYEEGNKKNELDITVFDLSKNVGWIQEGQKPVHEATGAEMKDFRDSMKHRLDGIFRFRYKDPNGSMYYLGPGEGHDVTLEMVKMLDSDNDEVTVYFDRISKFPAKIEYRRLTRKGVRQRVVEEFSQWHEIQGVNTPLRTDTFVNGRPAIQHFVTEAIFNGNLQDSLFTKPVPLK
jgi:hypothetical protein